MQSMMLNFGVTANSIGTIAESVARGLVSVRRVGDSSFINLPLVYPSGSAVTVRLDRVAKGIRVSDDGFAYRELESFGAQRSFGNTAPRIAEAEAIEVGRRTVYVDVSLEELERAICDVAAVSWQIADRIVGRLADEEAADIEEYLRERLVHVFAANLSRPPEHRIVGASSNEWDVSAVVQLPGGTAVFHAVSNHPSAVFKTSTAFHDLANLDNPPKLVAVVRDKTALGAKLALLAQAGRVIEGEQPDDVYLRAVA
jgi:hypothetical protein